MSDGIKPPSGFTFVSLNPAPWPLALLAAACISETIDITSLE